MVAYNQKTQKFFCDLFCYACEGWGMKSCLLLRRTHMRLACMQSIGSATLLEVVPFGDTYWKENFVLDEKIVEMGNFPQYRGERIH